MKKALLTEGVNFAALVGDFYTQLQRTLGAVRTLSPLDERLVQAPIKRLVVGFSGGADSTVALYLAKQAAAGLGLEVIALHINHLHKGELSYEWESVARSTATFLDVAFVCDYLREQSAAGESLEHFLREQRYQLIESHLQADDLLISGHHQDDQAETVLLQLLRSAGLEGLKAMPVLKKLGSARYWRPLLGVSKAQIYQFAQHYQLPYIDDVTNFTDEADRNYLRNQVLPVLSARWPHAAQAIATSAQWLSEIASPTPSNQLWIADLSTKPLLTQKQQLRHFVNHKTHLSLSQNNLQVILQTFLSASASRYPSVIHGDYTIRRYRGEILLTQTPPTWTAVQLAQANQALQTDLQGLESNRIGNNLATYLAPWGQFGWQSGQLRQSAQIGQGLPTNKLRGAYLGTLNAHNRFHLAGRAYSQQIKKLFQEQGIAQWLRVLHWGLFAAEGELLAILGLGISAQYDAQGNGLGADHYLPSWQVQHKFARL